MESLEALRLVGEELSLHDTLWEASVASRLAYVAGSVFSSLSASFLKS